MNTVEMLTKLRDRLNSQLKNEFNLIEVYLKDFPDKISLSVYKRSNFVEFMKQYKTPNNAEEWQAVENDFTSILDKLGWLK